MASIKDLKFDNKNFNKHTEFGMSLLEKSLRENGAGRSVLLDKDNNIIAGNGIIEAAGQIGLEKVKIIETTGDEIVAVKRTDIKLDSKQGRKMALADNATSSADLSWDWENIRSEFSDDEIEGFGLNVNDSFSDGENNEINIDDFSDKQELKIKFSPEEYQFVLEKLRVYGNDFAKSLLTILGYYEDEN